MEILARLEITFEGLRKWSCSHLYMVCGVYVDTWLWTILFRSLAVDRFRSFVAGRITRCIFVGFAAVPLRFGQFVSNVQLVMSCELIIYINSVFVCLEIFGFIGSVWILCRRSHFPFFCCCILPSHSGVSPDKFSFSVANVELCNSSTLAYVFLEPRYSDTLSCNFCRSHCFLFF